MRKLIFLLFFPSLLFAQNRYTPVLDNYFQAQADINGFSGAVLVMKNDSICLHKAYGYSDRAAQTLNDTATKFRIASITKEFTAVSILLLEERGKLSVNDRLSKYFPAFPKADSVTLHLLLCHRSGIKDYAEDKDLSHTSSWGDYTEEMMYKKIMDKGYDFPPGTEYSYSNSGYYLLGLIIEQVSGMKYEEFVKQNLFIPLNMMNTGVDRNDLVLPDKAKGYKLHKGDYRPADYFRVETAFSAGGIYSTVDDLYKWSKALKGDTLLNAGSRSEMFTPYSFTEEHYGYGSIIDTFLTHPKVWHSGGMNGFNSQLIFYRNDNITIVILANVECNCPQMSDIVSAMLFDLTVIPYHRFVEVKMNKDSLQKHTGTYKTIISYGRSSANEEVQIVRKGKKLYRVKSGAKKIQLVPEGNGWFFYNDKTERELEFVEDEKGNLLYVSFFIEGVKLEDWGKQ